MPAKLMECEGPCKGVKWNYGHWSECSVECGGGKQTRQVTML
jgi:hypothetical protein